MQDWKLDQDYVSNPREAFDLATRRLRAEMAEASFPGKSRVYQRVELSRMFSDGDDARRPTWEVIKYAIAHGDAEVLVDFILRARPELRNEQALRAVNSTTRP